PAKLITSLRKSIGNTYDTTRPHGPAAAISGSGGDVGRGLARRGPEFRTREIPLRGSHRQPRTAAAAFGGGARTLERRAPRQAPGLAYGGAARSPGQASGRHGARRTGDRGAQWFRDGGRGRARGGPGARPRQWRRARDARRRFRPPGVGAGGYGRADARRPRRSARRRHE